ncbi:hypothetical protein D029_3081A, partial [Vibrio parahaemolyticus 970107]
MSVTAF